VTMCFFRLGGNMRSPDALWLSDIVVCYVEKVQLSILSYRVGQIISNALNIDANYAKNI